MRLVIQRVLQASVTVDGELKAAIENGLLVLAGIGEQDDASDLQWLANKLVQLRIFGDEAGQMNRSLLETGGDLLVVSQFTLHASTRKGNRPSFLAAAKPGYAQPLYEQFCALLGQLTGREIRRGIFGADMKVALINDGPVTIIIDSKHRE